MIKLENHEVLGWEHAIRGMRNPHNSWDRSDTSFKYLYEEGIEVGENDHDLMMRLANGGPVHAKYRRMIGVYVDIIAPLYWWKEFDTYKVGTVANSCSTMHKIHEKKFTLEDFSTEHMFNRTLAIIKGDIQELNYWRDVFLNGGGKDLPNDLPIFIEDEDAAEYVNEMFELHLSPQAKEAWWQMIQLLPSSYNQKRTVFLNYEVLANIYEWRKDHKLDEWRRHDTPIEHCERNKDFSSGMWGFCDWIESLPYSEIITEPVKKKKETVKLVDELTKALEEANSIALARSKEIYALRKKLYEAGIEE